MATPFPHDPYMSKGFEPLRIECDCADLIIEGALPADLEGSFYRVGPNPQFAPRGPYNPLNGDGMIHAFHLKGGRAAYRNRWVRTRRWALERAAGRSLFGAPGDPSGSDPSVAGEPTDGTANTNLVRHAGRLLALEEGHAPIGIDPQTLATHGPWTFDGALPRNMTAHPKIDPVTGEMWAFANFPSGRQNGDIGVYRVSREGAIDRSVVLTAPFPALLHDFVVTERFVVFIVCPVTVSMRRAREGGPPVAWEPGLGVHVGVMPKDGGPEAARWFAGPDRMVWHVMNAWDEAGVLTIDLCEQKAAVFPLADGTPPDMGLASQHLSRWRIDWEGPRTFAAERLSEVRCEYPRFDERRAGLRYRYGFVACDGGPGSGDLFHRGIGRFDHEAGIMARWHAGDHVAVAEPVFAPRPGGGEGEGEGYLLSNLFDERRNASHLAVFDAQDVCRGPIARAHLDHRVPVGFHALWSPA